MSVLCRTSAALLGALCVLAACQIPDPAEADVERLVPLLCEEASTCFCVGDIGDADCETSRTDAWSTRIREGRKRSLAYDPACVEAQIERIDGYACERASDPGDGVQHLCTEFCAVFFADKEEGEDCEGFDAVVSDCMQELTCSNGRCQDPCESLTGLGPGQTCMTAEFVPIEDCAIGLYCDRTTRACVRSPEVGEPCPDGRCAGDAFCNYESNVCRDPATVGQSCQSSQCAPELYCNYDQNTRSERCEEYVEVDERCDSNQRCADGLSCNGTRCRPPAEAGENCGQIPCAPDLYCDENILRCLELPNADGDPCRFGECAGDLWCDTADDPDGLCRGLSDLGDPCSGHAQCSSVYCPAGRCAQRPGEGADCTGTNICQGGLVCVADVCEVAVGEGAAICVYPGW